MMNCALHPERSATAFCQNCGKALCPKCLRTADGLLLCEPCLGVRQAETAPSAAAASGWHAVSTPDASFASGSHGSSSHGSSSHGSSAGSSAQAGYPPVGRPEGVPGAQTNYGAAAPRSVVPGTPPYTGSRPSPFLAGMLSLIPGVGAMYNGQFVKALLHVVIFVVLIAMCDHFKAAGVLVATWVIYQVFDAAQTAAARRDGLPLPDPFGLLDMSRRLGPQGSGYPPVPSAPFPPFSGAPARPASVPPSIPYAAHAVSYVPVPPPMPPHRGEPIGAIVLIVVGSLLLMSTLGVLDVDWIGRGWPVLLLLLGIWLLVRRVRDPYLGTTSQPIPPSRTATPGNVSTQPPSPDARNPLSITPSAPRPHQESVREENKQ